MSWESINPKLNNSLIKILRSCNYCNPTPVQSSSIPYFLNNKDVCVEAVTGSGKTLAFVVPLLNIFIDKWTISSKCIYKIFAIILSPTRELAEQTYLVINKLAELLNNQMIQKLQNENNDNEKIENKFIRCQLLVGGSKTMESDIKQFVESGAHFLIATPGRLEYLLNKGAKILLKQNNDDTQAIINTITLAQCVKELEFLVLDEGDRLLELGFLPSLQNILEFLPKQRRTCLYSATLNEKLESFIKAGLRNPVSIVVKQKLTHSNSNNNEILNSSFQTATHNIPLSLSCYYSLVNYESKWAYLALLLYHSDISPLYCLLDICSISPKTPRNLKILVFVSNYSSAQYISKAFKLYHQHHIQSANSKHKSYKMDFELLCLHRKMRSNDRIKVLNKFKADGLKITAQKLGSKKITKSKTTRNVKILISTDLMARGIDVEGIDWVIHADPPSDIEKFIHRSGRTARIQKSNEATLSQEEETSKDPCNSSGNTLILLHEGQEENFIDFLAINQNIMVKPFPPISDGALNNSLSRLRHLIIQEAKNDRAFMLKGIKAFVSHVRSYRENKLSLIFRIQDLELGHLANSFGLLYLPRMPELAKSYRKKLRDQGIKTNASHQAHQKVSTDMEERLGFIKPTMPGDLSATQVGTAISKISSNVNPHSQKLQETSQILSSPFANIEDGNVNKTLTRRQRVKRKQILDQKDIDEFAHDAKILKQIKNHKISQHKFDEFYSGF